MEQQTHTDSNKTSRYSPRASLAALGLKLKSIDFFMPIRELVKIPQKMVKYSPFDKLCDAFITILAGAHGIVEANTRLRSDEALQRAFGRRGCAEQSVIQDTLSASTAENLAQMVQAKTQIFRAHGLAYRHNYQESYQLLDVDVTGMPCGKKAESAKNGYCGNQGIRYCRQLGRVVAAHYEEVVVDCLYPGNIYLSRSLPQLVEATEQVLELDEARRQRTILRFDAGGGSFEFINWMLSRGYQIHGKAISSEHAKTMAQTVTTWIDDPKHPGRQLGWANEEMLIGYDYVRPVRRLVTRWPQKDGKLKHALLLSTLTPEDVLTLTRRPKPSLNDPKVVIMAYAYFYDGRGGTVEIEIKEDKQGIGITRRSKKKFEGQQMIMQLGSLAHNTIVWSRRWLAGDAPRFARYGILRIVRDLMHTSGLVRFDAEHGISSIMLSRTAQFVGDLAKTLRALLLLEQIDVDIGEI